MATPLLAMFAFQAAALVGFLAMAAGSKRLVDENGRPLATAWREHRVPSLEDASEPTALPRC